MSNEFRVLSLMLRTVQGNARTVGLTRMKVSHLRQVLSILCDGFDISVMLRRVDGLGYCKSLTDKLKRLIKALKKFHKNMRKLFRDLNLRGQVYNSDAMRILTVLNHRGVSLNIYSALFPAECAFLRRFVVGFDPTKSRGRGWPMPTFGGRGFGFGISYGPGINPNTYGGN